MKCMIPGKNVKILARALHALARVGDDLFVDSLTDGLVLRTVNSAQSAFAEFIFIECFFSSYNTGVESPDMLPNCKISMRSCLSVFKSPHSMDKMIDWCQLRLEPNGVQLILKLKFVGGATRTYFLPIIECETLQVKYQKSDRIKLVASSKLLSGVVKNFRLNEDEITLGITRQKTTFRNHIDSSGEKNKLVRTELGLLAGEFEMYSVKEEPVSVTFCLKQLRAIVSFAEPSGLPITVFFEAPGRPVIFSVSSESIYEANFVVSSLASLIDVRSQDTQKSSVSANSSVPKQSSLQLVEKEKQVASQINPPNVKPSSSNVRENISFKSVIRNSHVYNASRKRRCTSDERDCNSLHKDSLSNNSDKDMNGQSSSHSSSQDTILIPNNGMELDANNGMELDESIPSSQSNTSVYPLKDIFSRCVNVTFQRNSLPGFNKVIAYDSDGLEDSD
ncbi:cell cycle checkpoint control protein Rad9 [Lycorma delicatula]|uniref:cell cycle checkpoint control protein Rad9 n=1 Tax=Lycorma delicatula TaxID=130591 RepID=UPI003F5116CD